MQYNHLLCPGGGIGRHKGFKIPRGKPRAGSSPALGTIKTLKSLSFDEIKKYIFYKADFK